MLEYEELRIGPKTVQFHIRALQGRRIFQIYLDLPTPRFKVWTETKDEQIPAMGWATELDALILRAEEICGIR